MKKHYQFHRFFILIMVIVTLLLLVGASYVSAQVPTVTPIPTLPSAVGGSNTTTYVVQRGTVQETLTFSGQWLPRDQQIISFDAGGTIRGVYVQANDRVTTGMLLADFQIDDLETQLEQAQLDLQQAQANLNTSDNSSNVLNAQFGLADANLSLQSTLDGSPWTSVNNARISLDAAQDDLEIAERNYNNAIGDPSNSPSTIDNAYNSLKDAERNVLRAQNSYWAAAQSFNNYQYNIAGAENRFLRAEINLAEAVQGGNNESQLQAVDDAQLRVDQLTSQVNESSIYAPFDAMVLNVSVSSGTQVNAFQEVLTLALPEPLEVVASLSQNDAQRLSIGLIGVCQVMNQPETAVQCIVRQVPLGNDAPSVRIAATLQNVPMGQMIQVQMPLGVRENVLWLPAEAIRTFQNRTFVIVQGPQGEQVVDITLGLRTNDRVEIVSGLSEGDIVLGQ